MEHDGPTSCDEVRSGPRPAAHRADRAREPSSDGYPWVVRTRRTTGARRGAATRPGRRVPAHRASPVRVLADLAAVDAPQ
jgi:hypothetical protein